MNRHPIRALLTVLILLSGSLCLTAQTANDFEILMKRIRQDFSHNPDIEAILPKFDAASGSFPDIDYSSIQRTHWPPLTHIERISDFAFAYTHPDNPHYREASLFQKIQKGLEFWHERNPWCHNWWYNQIAEPQAIGVLLIQMRAADKLLPRELETKLLERIEKDGGHPAKWTGANRTDIALHWIYRACLTADEDDLQLALDHVYSPLVYTTEEGFQHDNSYFQHGQQLYIGGYGDEIIKGITQVAMYTRNTRYAIPKEKLDILSKFMRETYYQTIRGEYMLFDVLGRGVSRPGNTRKNNSTFAKRMLELDPEHADEFQAIIDRLEGRQPAHYALQPKHTHYFRADYTLHVRPRYTFDVRTVSNRTLRCEYGNQENLKTYFLSDGCTNIVIDGNEYDSIFPVWNWARIPGVTAPQMDTIPLARKSWQAPGTSTFAGGVSDSLHGASTYVYTDDYAGINTQARKSWFFFDDEIVCLGAGIRSTAQAEVHTTVNQCLLHGREVIVSTRGKTSLLPPHTTAQPEAEWVLHNQVGYLFPQPGKLYVSNQIQRGDWHDINQSFSSRPTEKEVFCLGLNHGLSPVDAGYTYIVVPGIESVKEMKAYRKRCSIEILANTEEQQIVRHREAGIWQMIFHQAGTFKYKDLTVKVTKPCALMLKELGGKKVAIHVADPAQAQAVIEVEVDFPRKLREAQKVVFDFTGSGIYAGASQGRVL